MESQEVLAPKHFHISFAVARKSVERSLDLPDPEEVVENLKIPVQTGDVLF